MTRRHIFDHVLVAWKKHIVLKSQIFEKFSKQFFSDKVESRQRHSSRVKDISPRDSDVTAPSFCGETAQSEESKMYITSCSTPDSATSSARTLQATAVCGSVESIKSDAADTLARSRGALTNAAVLGSPKRFTPDVVNVSAPSTGALTNTNRPYLRHNNPSESQSSQNMTSSKKGVGMKKIFFFNSCFHVQKEESSKSCVPKGRPLVPESIKFYSKHAEHIWFSGIINDFSVMRTLQFFWYVCFLIKLIPEMRKDCRQIRFLHLLFGHL